jgi:hypothetical protein
MVFERADFQVVHMGRAKIATQPGKKNMQQGLAGKLTLRRAMGSHFAVLRIPETSLIVGRESIPP